MKIYGLLHIDDAGNEGVTPSQARRLYYQDFDGYRLGRKIHLTDLPTLERALAEVAASNVGEARKCLAYTRPVELILHDMLGELDADDKGGSLQWNQRGMLVVQVEDVDEIKLNPRDGQLALLPAVLIAAGLHSYPGSDFANKYGEFSGIRG